MLFGEAYRPALVQFELRHEPTKTCVSILCHVHIFLFFFFLTRYPQAVKFVVVVGFAKTSDGHNHPKAINPWQSATFAYPAGHTLSTLHCDGGRSNQGSAQTIMTIVFLAQWINLNQRLDNKVILVRGIVPPKTPLKSTEYQPCRLPNQGGKKEKKVLCKWKCRRPMVEGT